MRNEAQKQNYVIIKNLLNFYFYPLFNNLKYFSVKINKLKYIIKIPLHSHIHLLPLRRHQL